MVGSSLRRVHHGILCEKSIYVAVSFAGTAPRQNQIRILGFEAAVLLRRGPVILSPVHGVYASPEPSCRFDLFG
jgi:hypothetical protein